MNSVFILILAILGMVAGYGWYAKSIDKKIIQPDNSKTTPATMYMDGVDFTPANRNVLFGYQFKSVAALGPIVGPIVAVRWGWRCAHVVHTAVPMLKRSGICQRNARRMAS